jgi:hydrogenase-1 operon protein HyaF
VWWVQYFNSQDTLILNTLEVSDVPNVACASPEDIADSRQRLEEIMKVYL